MEKPLAQNTPSRSMVIWSMTYTSGVSQSAFGNGEEGATEAILSDFGIASKTPLIRPFRFLDAQFTALKKRLAAKAPFYNTLSGEALAVFFTRFTNSKSIF